MSSKKDVRIPIEYQDIPSHELFTCELSKPIYHYTDYDGAKGIIENKSLWMTKLSYLNDKSELKLAIDLFRASANELVKRIEGDEKKGLLVETAHQLQSFQETNICVASFCENEDLLSQWRSYGNGGACVALGFNAKLLKGLSNKGLMNLWRCVYKPHEQKRIIDDLINILMRSYDVINSTRDTCEDWNKAKSDLIGSFNTTFLRVAPVIKNHHFHEEKEWRIITASKPYTDKNWFSRISNNRVSQYYRLDFGLLDKGVYELLDGIIIGPTEEPRLVSEAFMVLLYKAGYKRKNIGYSQIPYTSR